MASSGGPDSRALDAFVNGDPEPDTKINGADEYDQTPPWADERQSEPQTNGHDDEYVPWHPVLQSYWKTIAGLPEEKRLKLWRRYCKDARKLIHMGRLEIRETEEALLAIADNHGLFGLLSREKAKEQQCFLDIAHEPPLAAEANGHDRAEGEPKPKPVQSVCSGEAFVAEFIPPDYLIKGIIQRRFFYSLTARTGGGKTAVLLLIAACVALGRALGPHTIKPGRVLYFAGENPDDVRMRWILMSAEMGFDIKTTDVYFVPGRLTLSQMKKKIRDETDRIGPFTLIIFDTSAAYFEGKDENANVDAGNHGRLLRAYLEVVPGGPTVIAACHPPKNAGEDNLIPRGGGAFLAEVDGNLTCVHSDPLVEVHWQGKIRGPDFPPISFRLEQHTTDRLVDSDGNKLPSVMARWISEGERAMQAAEDISKEDRLLRAINENPDKSYSQLAEILGWYHESGGPAKSRVGKCAKSLLAGKLVEKERSFLVLTKSGREALKKATASAGEATSRTRNRSGEQDFDEADL
jgi:hypothetical protein